MLAKELVSTHDLVGIQEIASGLNHSEKNVRSDCLKVLYEIGYLEPGLIAPYGGSFLPLVRSKDNRMVWGAFIALATIASLRTGEITGHIPELVEAFNRGSVITRLWGMRLFAWLSAADSGNRRSLFPVMLQTLKTCIPRDVPTFAESMLPCIGGNEKPLIQEVLQRRMVEMSPSQAARCCKVIRSLESFN